jgi:hypothetical protein
MPAKLGGFPHLIMTRAMARRWVSLDRFVRTLLPGPFVVLARSVCPTCYAERVVSAGFKNSGLAPDDIRVVM